MSFIVEILLEALGQIVLEMVAEGVWGFGDVATGSRMKRVVVFAVAGGAAGLVSHWVRPGIAIPDPLTRYAVIAALAIAGGLFLALFEARILRRGKGAAASGFLSGVAFGLGYTAARRLMLP